MSTNLITVTTTVEQPLSTVWKAWTDPAHITHWNFASPDWCCPAATNDPQPGGKFSWRMEARDGSMGFDYSGTYEEVENFRKIAKRLDDGRMVTILFTENDGATTVTESFEPDEVDQDLQKQGWQAILNNFKSHAESLS